MGCGTGCRRHGSQLFGSLPSAQRVNHFIQLSPVDARLFLPSHLAVPYLHRTGWKAASSGTRPIFSTLTNTDYNLSNLLFLYLSQGKVEYSVTQSTLITISSFLDHQVRMWQREARGAEQSEDWDPMNLERQMPRSFDRLWITCHLDVPRFPSFGGDLNRKQRKTGDTPFF